MIHPSAEIHTLEIGVGTTIWQNVIILEKARIGKECNICSCVYIENDVILGDRVTVKNGAMLYDGLVAEDDTFIGPGVIFTNHKYPFSNRGGAKFSGYPITYVRKGASIGAGCIIMPGITIGRNSLIGSGSVVTKNIPPNCTAMGNPARISQ